MPVPDRQKASISPLSLTLIKVTIFTKKKIHPDTYSSSVISDISHFPSCYLLPFVDIPKASRAEPETVEGGSKYSISTQLSVPNMSEHVFNISSLNMHEIKCSRLCWFIEWQGLFWNVSVLCIHTQNLLFIPDSSNFLSDTWAIRADKHNMLAAAILFL